MGRFGIHSNFAGGWETALPGVRPLIPGDPTRIAAVLLAVAVTASLPVTWLWPGLAIAALVPAIVNAAAKVPLRLALLRLAAILPFGVLAVFFLPWIGGGERYPVAGLSLSRTGSLHAVAALLKLSAACLWITFLFATTSVPRLLAGLRALRVPALFVDILESTLHGLALLARETGRMLLASRARSCGRTRTLLSMQRLGDLVASLFVRTLHRGTRCAAAREARTVTPMNMKPAAAGTDRIDIDALSFRYPGSDHDALTAINLSIPCGRKIAFLGTNGAGKTTLLLHLNGVHLPQSGALRIHGIEAARDTLPLLRRKVGMVFQDPDDQVVGTTAYEDVCFGLRQLGLAEETVRERAEEALGVAGLREKRDRPPHSLSRGERKRAAIAGVLAVGAEILVFDEPMASLDPAGKEEIAVLLHDLHLEGKTIVAATHDVDFAATWADAVVLLDAGRILASGPPDLLVDERLMSAAGLALPLVARPFQMLRPHAKDRQADLDPVPRNANLAFRWLRDHCGMPRTHSRPAPTPELDKPAPRER